MANSETESFTANVPLALAHKVDEIARRLDRSRDWILNQALGTWIDQEAERSRLTHEALAEVDAGIVIDHQAVLDWAGSLSSSVPTLVPHP